MQLKPSALAGWVLFLLLLFLSVFYALAGLGTSVTVNAAAYLVLGGAEILIFGIPALVLRQYKPFRSLIRLRGRPAHRYFAMNVLFASLAVAFASFSAYAPSFLLSGGVPEGLSAFYPIHSGVPEGFAWIMALSLVIIPGIMEEMLLRGAVFSLYEKRGTAAALIMTTLAQAMLQRDPGMLGPALVMGLGCGLLAYCTDSVWPCMLAHMAVNGYAMLTGVLAEFYPDAQFWRYYTAGNTAAFFLCAYVAVRTLRNLVREEQVPEADPGPAALHVNLAGAVTTKGFLLFTGLFAVRMILAIVARQA